MDNIAVFGGGGFIGSHLCRRLVNNGYRLSIIDIASEKISDVIANDNVEFHRLDIQREENDKKCRSIVLDVDVVIDLIAYANPQEYVDKPLDVVDLNYDQNLKIVEACVESNTRLIQFSTCEVYGKVGNRSGDDLVFKEDTSDLVMGPVEKHRWIYATAKQLLERMVHAHGMQNGLEWTIVRPFNFIGPQMDYIIKSPEDGTPRVFASFMSALLYDHPIHLVNGGVNRRSFTFIQDAVDAIELIIDNDDGHFTNEIVNIGTPDNETTIRDLAHLMIEIYKDRSPDGDVPEVVEVPGEEFYGEGYGDSERRIPAIDKLQEAGWSPSHDLRDTLEKSMIHYINRYEREKLKQSG